MKEDRQAYGVMLGEEVNLEEVFSYFVTSVSVCLAFSDSTFRQSQNYHFGNYLIDVTDVTDLIDAMHL